MIPQFVRRWFLRSQLDQIEYRLAQLHLQRQQDRQEERLLAARRAVIKSELSQS